MNHRTAIAFVALSFVALSFTAVAASGAELYLGAGISGEIDSGEARAGLDSFAETDGSAWRLFAGARLNRFLAVEIAHHDLGTQRCCVNIADLGFNTDVDALSAAAIGRWQRGIWAPFVKLGLLAWEEDGEMITFAGSSPLSRDGTELLVGAGVEVELPVSFAVRADWERYEFGEASSDGLWLSALYRF